MTWQEMDGNLVYLANQGGGSVGITEATYSEIISMVSTSNLTVGVTYKITDRGDRGLFFQTLSVNELSKTGIRKMLCPAWYSPGLYNGNNWIGVWNNTKITVIDNLAIWGGKVWKNLTGVIGNANADNELDLVNWIEIPKVSFTNNEYVQMQFGVSYDLSNDWIDRQWDSKGNIFGIDYYLEQEYWDYGYNLCDISDWNLSSSDLGSVFANNITMGVWNNHESIGLYNNRVDWGIYGNRCNWIENNMILGEISINSNTGGISNNTGGSINGNFNYGSIHDNFITDSITNNSNTGDIHNNTNAGAIANNYNNGNITYNANNGAVQGNSNLGIITFNTNNGAIDYCQSTAPCDIIYNVNNGGIQGIFDANVTDPRVDKSASITQ